MSEWNGDKCFLPSKTCPVCEQVFWWQKKWARCWHRVVYCGPDCREVARSTEAMSQRQNQQDSAEIGAAE